MIVVGAGIVGSACAWWLARAGLAVDIIDPEAVGTQSTASAMGHLVVMDDSEAQFALCHRSRVLWDTFLPHLPAACEVDTSGTLWVARDEDELAAAEARRDFYRDRDVKAEMVAPAQLAAYEPNLRKGFRGALLVPQDASIYPPAAARWLMDKALEIGAKFHRGRKVEAIADGGVLTRDGEVLKAPVVVNAAGMAALELLRGIDLGLAMRPRKGHLVITDRVPGFCRRQVLEFGYLKRAHGDEDTSVAFNIQPRRTGQMLIGSSRQFDVSSREVELPILSRMLTRAQEFMPRIADLNCVRAWTGIRAATPDGLPLIGPILSAPGVFLAAGHEGLGITTALATAELITNVVMERRSRIDGSPYLPGRFAESKGLRDVR
ncbi:MAG: FAD-dependent oxidoreductase [Planctomycetota bacterium]